MVSLRPPTREECTNPLLLPLELRDWGFPYLTPEWTWIVEHSGQPIALIICSFCGGLLIFWRILSTPSAKRVCRNWIRPTLHSIIDNARIRGCVGYLSMFDDSRPSETQLARIVARTGGVLRPFCGTLGVGVLEGVECPISESLKPSP